MHSLDESYPDQFAPAPDPLHLAIPRLEIVAEMALRGEHAALNDACLAVALTADALALARDDAES
ncbi:MAG: hypothetical protein AAF648_02835 [Pseudomonadota bacterium]